MNNSTVPFSPIALVGTITLLVAYLVAAYSVAGYPGRTQRLKTAA